MGEILFKPTHDQIQSSIVLGTVQNSTQLNGKLSNQESLEAELLCFECANYLINFEQRIDIVLDGVVYKNVLSMRLFDSGKTFECMAGPALV